MSFKHYVQNSKVQEAIQYNKDKNIPLSECIFRRESSMFYEYYSYLNENKDSLNLDESTLEMLDCGLGTQAMYHGKLVPLGLPFVNPLSEADYKGKDVELNKPQKGGNKKFYVYVKNDKGHVVKVEFGDPNMSVKFNDEGARKSFAARHKCKDKTDKTTAGYWSCNLPKYAKYVGLSDGGNFFW